MIRLPLRYLQNYIGHMCGIRHALAKKLHLCGQSGTKGSQLMNEGCGSHQPLFLNNVSSASLTRASWSNMNFGIAPKPGESTGDGPPPSCMSFVGLIRMGNYDNFNWKANPLWALWVENSKRFVEKIKTWHLLRGIALWMIRIERNDKVFNMNNGMTSSCTPKPLGLGWLNLPRFTSTRPKPSAKTLMKLGELGTLFVDGIE